MKKIVAICVSATKIRSAIIDTFPKKKYASNEIHWETRIDQHESCKTPTNCDVKKSRRYSSLAKR